MSHGRRTEESDISESDTEEPDAKRRRTRLLPSATDESTSALDVLAGVSSILPPARRVFLGHGFDISTVFEQIPEGSQIIIERTAPRGLVEEVLHELKLKRDLPPPHFRFRLGSGVTEEVALAVVEYLPPDCMLYIDENVSPATAEKIANSLAPECAINLLPDASMETREAVLSTALRREYPLVLRANTPAALMKTLMKRLPLGTGMILGPLVSADSIEAVEYLPEGRFLMFKDGTSIEFQTQAVSRLPKHSQYRLDPNLPTDSIRQVISKMTGFRHLLLSKDAASINLGSCYEATSSLPSSCCLEFDSDFPPEQVRPICEKLKPSRLAFISPKMPLALAEAIVTSLPPFTAIMFDPQVDVSVAKQVISKLNQSCSLYLRAGSSPKFAKEVVPALPENCFLQVPESSETELTLGIAAASSLQRNRSLVLGKDGDYSVSLASELRNNATLIATPTLPAEAILKLARAIKGSAYFMLLSTTPIDTLEKIIPDLPNNCKLYLHSNFPQDKLETIIKLFPKDRPLFFNAKASELRDTLLRLRSTKATLPIMAASSAASHSYSYTYDFVEVDGALKMQAFSRKNREGSREAYI